MPTNGECDPAPSPLYAGERAGGKAGSRRNREIQTSNEDIRHVIHFLIPRSQFLVSLQFAGLELNQRTSRSKARVLTQTTRELPRHELNMGLFRSRAGRVTGLHHEAVE